MNPKVSIIVPVYNLENYITETLKTILNQSYTNLEIIIIDDCSSDDTFSVINQISDARLKIFRQKKNMGVSAARNLGLSVATGEFVQFVDGDDLLESNAVEQLIEIVTKENCDIVCFNLKVISDGETTLSLREKRYSKQSMQNQVVNGNGALKLLFLDKIKHTPPTYLFKLNLWRDNNIYFPTDRHYGEDYATIYKVLSVANLVATISNRLYYYVQRSTSSTHSSEIEFAVDNLKTTYEIDSYFKMYNPNIKKLAIRYTIPRLITALSIASKAQASIETKNVVYKISTELLLRSKEIYMLKRTFSLNIRFKLMLNQFHLLSKIFKIV